MPEFVRSVVILCALHLSASLVTAHEVCSEQLQDELEAASASVAADDEFVWNEYLKRAPHHRGHRGYLSREFSNWSDCDDSFTCIEAEKHIGSFVVRATLSSGIVPSVEIYPKLRRMQQGDPMERNREAFADLKHRVQLAHGAVAARRFPSLFSSEGRSYGMWDSKCLDNRRVFIKIFLLDADESHEFLFRILEQLTMN